MALIEQTSSLINPDAAPIATSLQWIGAVVFDQIAVGLCVLAVAFVGYRMLIGRISLRTGLRVVLGCSVLLGAPVIATSFMASLNDRPAAIAAVPDAPESSPRGELERAEYDPYAGASLRSD